MTGIEQAMKDLVSEVTHTVVERLSERYSFDVSEALKVLNEERSPKKKTEKGKDRKSERMTPSIPLPFCGVVNEDWCHGVRLNHGLHTQCLLRIGTRATLQDMRRTGRQEWIG